MNTALSFQHINFDIIDRFGMSWLRLPQVGAALGYASPYKVQQVYDRNADEFTDQMTAVVELDTPGGKQKTRIFSLRGAHLLAMLARTPVAKAFRKWVLDILDREAARNGGQPEAVDMDPSRAIHDAVHAVARGNQSIARRLYSRLHGRFGVGSYKDITVARCTEALEYIRSVEGEYIPKAEPVKEVAPVIPEAPAGQLVSLLPQEQAQEIHERLDRIMCMFHPFSEPFRDALAIRRALCGRDPRTGTDRPKFVQVVEMPERPRG